jgi:hypothetical protein
MHPENLKELADAKFKHALYRKNLRERIEAQLAVAYNGGLFKATPELMGFLWMWPSNEMVLEDVYHNPIKIDDKVKLLLQLEEAYQFAMNAWHVDFEESKKIRNATQL